MSNVFSPMEISAIGEITNISLGSSATAISNMLDHRVDITTPTVSIVNAEDFEELELIAKASVRTGEPIYNVKQ